MADHQNQEQQQQKRRKNMVEYMDPLLIQRQLLLIQQQQRQQVQFQYTNNPADSGGGDTQQQQHPHQQQCCAFPFFFPTVSTQPQHQPQQYQTNNDGFHSSLDNGQQQQQQQQQQLPVALGTVPTAGTTSNSNNYSTYKRSTDIFPFMNEATPYNNNNNSIGMATSGHESRKRRLHAATASAPASATVTTNVANTPGVPVPVSDGSTVYRSETPILPSVGPPPSNPREEETDKLLAQELNSLSLKERHLVYEDVHGVAVVSNIYDQSKNTANQAASTTDGGGKLDGRVGNNIAGPVSPSLMIGDVGDQEEDPFEAVQLVEDVIDFLTSIPTRRKSAYLLAVQQNEQYVHHYDFIMRFLRSDRYNVKDAAHRVVGFFEYKRELFGMDKLTKDIGVEDFYGPDAADPQNDRLALESGLFQLLPGNDRSGRAVIVKYHNWDFEHFPLLSKLRVFYYLMMVATATTESQLRGVVIVVFNMIGANDREETWRNTTLLWSLPVKVCAFHVCHDANPNTKGLTALAVSAVNTCIRMRVRVHEGALIENLYQLQTFGISNKVLAIEPGNDKVDNVSHKAWIDRRSQEEGFETDKVTSMDQDNISAMVASTLIPFVSSQNAADSRTTSSSIVPTSDDVLFGRGKNSMTHPGNVRMREIIESKLGEYESSRQLAKTKISSQVVHSIKDAGGRFLKQDASGNWEEVDTETCRDKISHLFRDQRRKYRQHKKKDSAATQNLLV